MALSMRVRIHDTGALLKCYVLPEVLAFRATGRSRSLSVWLCYSGFSLVKMSPAHEHRQPLRSNDAPLRVTPIFPTEVRPSFTPDLCNRQHQTVLAIVTYCLYHLPPRPLRDLIDSSRGPRPARTGLLMGEHQRTGSFVFQVYFGGSLAASDLMSAY